MQIKTVRIHNFRSIPDAEFHLYDYTLLVGANNAGKSNVLSALRVFYEDKLKFSEADDMPRCGCSDAESWIEVVYVLDEEERAELKVDYRRADDTLVVRKLLASQASPERVKPTQSNLYAVADDGTLDENLFYGARNVSQAKLGEVIFIPSVSLPADALKTSGPSPLRDTLSFLLKRVVNDSAAYKELQKAIDKLSEEGTAADGFLDQIAAPVNKALKGWGITLQLGVAPISPDDLAKNLIRTEFVDPLHGTNSLSLDHFGQGFQRSLIYELIQLAASVSRTPPPTKGFSPQYTLLLFEEPEAFLHPHQQETLASRLRSLADEASQQVVLTTHSPLFVSRTAKDLKSVIRLSKRDGVTAAHQVGETELSGILQDGLALQTCLQAFVDDPGVDDDQKKRAKGMLAQAPPTQAIAEQEEAFRLQLWLDPSRCAMFFADRVVLVEGATEKALFDYLLDNDWLDLHDKHICVVDALGKFNIHRFMALFERFGIQHGVLLDSDGGKNEHGAVNDMIAGRANAYTVAKPHLFAQDLEDFLALQLPDRNDQKPVKMLAAATNGSIDPAKLAALRTIFETELLAL